MRLKETILILFLSISLQGFTQTQYGFEWIKPYQPYFKFKIVTDGAYFVNAGLLAANGINLSATNPDRIQIFRNGVEIPVFINGQNDTILSAGDHIEFYAAHNDGKLDQQMYQQPQYQPHQLYSMFTDTAVYFLTILPDTFTSAGLRYRSDNNNQFSLFTPEPYFIHDVKVFPTDYYIDGPDQGIGLSDKYNSSEYLEGEGWASNYIGFNDSLLYALPTPFKYTSGPSATVDYKIIPVNNSYTSTGFNHHVTLFAGPDITSLSQIITDDLYNGYTVQHPGVPPSYGMSLIGNSLTYFKMVVPNDLGVIFDYNSISYIDLKYPRQYNLGNQTNLFFLVGHVIGDTLSLIRFLNYGNGTSTNPIFFDMTSNRRFRGVLNSGTASALIKNAAQQSQVYLTDSLQITAVNALIPVQFQPLANKFDPTAGYQYLIISNPKLANSASQYAQYRSIKYKTLLTYSQELYDYYMYGNYHPLAVRRMASHFLNSSAAVKPQFLLLAGRGFETDLIRNPADQFYTKNLVPSIGAPSSDVMFTNAITGSGFEADIPTGRIPAETDQDLLNYLQKVKTYEASDYSEWRKNIIHVSGGNSAFEESNFAGLLSANKNVIQGKSFGGNVVSFVKSTSSTISTDQKVPLINAQNAGASMLTFMGHASSTVLDVDIGGITDLTNTNKYPLYYLNGCNAGNANWIDPGATGLFYGKYYMCNPNVGGIAWLANTNLSIDLELTKQINAFYNQFCVLNYGMPLGYIIQQTSKSFAGQGVATKLHNIQWLLQGDPAVIINSPTLPDYKVDSLDLFVIPNNANAMSDSFAVAVIVTNLGRATDDSLDITLTRTYPDPTKIVTITQTYPAVYFKDTFYFWIKSKDPSARGDNKFDVTLDRSNKISEITKTNNSATFHKLFAGTGLTNLFPIDFGIVNLDTVLLIAQNNDYFAPSNTQYVFEIDTVDLNNPGGIQSPFFKRSPVIFSGSVAMWKVVLPKIDSVVYFWHSKLNNVPVAQGGMWNESSFTYIGKGQKGWAQSQFGQYRQVSKYNNLVFDSSGKQIRFSPFTQTVTTKTKRWDHSNMGNFDPYFMDPKTGPNPNPLLGCGLVNGIVVDIFDSKTLQPIQCPRFPWTCQYVINENAAAQDVWYYTFNTTSQPDRDNFRAFIDSLDNGTYIAIWARYDADVRDWDALTKSYLGKIGSQKVGSIQSEYTTFALIGRKGWAPGMAQEDTLYNDKYAGQPIPNSNDQDTLIEHLQMVGNWYEGDMTSDKIGPANKWGKVFYNYSSTENNFHDYYYVDLLGVRPDGTDTVIFSNISTGKDISTIDVKAFPYLKLRTTFADTLNRTPDQYGRWMITYQETAEGTISPVIAYSFHDDKISQGDSMKMKMGFMNLTSIAFDSVPVEIKITDSKRVLKYSNNFMMPPLSANGSMVVTQSVPTKNMSGDNSLQLTVNGNMRTPEITLSNNFWIKNFTVMSDNINPIMEVTFDGYRIMNGDYVSPTPLIRVTSKDENPFLIQNDTGTFALFLKRPNSNTFEPVYMNSASVRFIPGTTQNNKAILEYTPARLDDGIYTLQVISKDAAGNLSGTNVYAIDFNVKGESTISNFFPYPNPCTTNMKFVFTLTGARIPDDLLIRIMTVSGKVIREVTKNEFGNIHIGNNISDWAWDGTDMYGDRLANGVYLYQVMSRIDGESIKKLDTKTDKYFIQNTGKITLLH